MAPKRDKKIVVRIRSTKKLVQQTVQVSVVSSGKRSTGATKESQKDEEGNTRTQAHVRTIPVQEVTHQAPKENASTTEKEPEEKTEHEEDTRNGEKQIKEGSEGNDGGRNKGMKRRRKRGGRSGEGYRRYVHRVLKQVHPEMGFRLRP